MVRLWARPATMKISAPRRDIVSRVSVLPNWRRADAQERVHRPASVEVAALALDGLEAALRRRALTLARRSAE
jgi:hypothetical protein